LRFTDVDARSADALRRLVHDLGGPLDDGAYLDEAHAEAGYVSGAYRDEAHPEAGHVDEAYADEGHAYSACADEAYSEANAAHADEAFDEEPAAIELRLDGVGSPLVAELAHESSHAIVVEQELPFLRLGTGVTGEDGRRGHLHAVDLRLDGALPRLVLTVRYEVDEIAEATEVAAARAIEAEPEEEPLDTLPDLLPAVEEVAAFEAPLEAVPVRRERVIETPVEYAESPRFEEAFREASSSRPRALEAPEHEDDADRGHDLVSDVRSRIEPALAAARAFVLTLWARLVPALRRAAERARSGANTAREEGRPMIERGVSRLNATTRRFFAIVRERAA
ncbi:MAG: hypothetical protein H5U40_13095, partial [Polyangiaceae bacterium]|nr:hypothetical protein [Polyangiaceae bacterium]